MEKDKDVLYVSASEVLKYLDDMMTVLASIVDGIEESKKTLMDKVEEHKNNQEESKDEPTKGETNDGE